MGVPPTGRSFPFNNTAIASRRRPAAGACGDDGHLVVTAAVLLGRPVPLVTVLSNEIVHRQLVVI